MPDCTDLLCPKHKEAVLMNKAFNNCQRAVTCHEGRIMDRRRMMGGKATSHLMV